MGEDECAVLLMFAYLLVYHGSRDRRPGECAYQLARLAADRLPECALASAAALELHPLPLHEQIAEFADRAVAAGCDRVRILPLFLLAGVHACEDIPEEVATATKRCRIPLDMLSYLGSHKDMAALLAEKMAASPQVEAWVLVSHGSRRHRSNEAIAQLSQQVGDRVDRPVVAAFWSGDGDLETRIGEWVDRGHQQIGILPYFLFSGGITEAIAESVRSLGTAFPQVQLTLAEPLGVDEGLVHLVVDFAGDSILDWGFKG